MKTIARLLVLIPGIAACASTPEPPRVRPEMRELRSGDVATAPAVLVPASVVEAPAAAEPPVAAPAEPSAPRPGDDVLDIWDEPSFRRQFAESYVAETDVEPELDPDEREAIQEVPELMAGGQLDEAARLLRKHAGKEASASVDFLLGNVLFQQDRFDEAIAAYRTAVDKFPKFRRAWQNLGVTTFKQGAFDEAITAQTRVVVLGGGNAVTYGLLGYAYFQVGEFVSAESALRMAVLLDPKILQWKTGLARTFFREGRYADAASLCDELIDAHPENAELWLLQANAYIGLRQPLEAAENFELVDGLGRSTADSLNTLGDIYVNEELYDLAARSYLSAMDLAPEAGAARALRNAKVLVAHGALEETRQLVERIEAAYADRLDDDQRKDMLKLHARLAVATGADEEQIRVLEQIVALDPLDGETLILLGDHELAAGDTEKAILYYERAEELERYEAEAKKRHAQILVREGKFADALPLLRRAQALDPSDGLENFLAEVEQRVARNR